MSDPRDIVNLVSIRLSKILTIAEAILPQDQFRPFRKLVLDEFGRNGLESDIYELLGQHGGKRKG